MRGLNGLPRMHVALCRKVVFVHYLLLREFHPADRITDADRLKHNLVISKEIDRHRTAVVERCGTA